MKTSKVVLLHIGYWLMYLLSVSLFLLIESHGAKIDIIHPVFIGSIIPACLGFYSFYRLLFDKFLAKNNYTQLFISGALIVLAAPLITLTLLYFIYFGRIRWDWQTLLFSTFLILTVTLINGILGLVLKGFINWFDQIKIKIELDKKNYETELALMKAQINPHFLFNTINNIDGLIHQDADKASEYLNKLSEIMRFMLYETKPEKIPLTKELSYIEKYIELQKIRTSNKNYISYEVQGNPDGMLVPSMLFIPFIENAFKHTEDKRVENAIKIRFKLGKDKISFECENAHTTSSQLKPEYGGLGNDLIQRRLALLYKAKHSIEVTDKNGIYKVSLILLN